MKNGISMGSMNRHKLIDCTELFSKSITKKAATARTSSIFSNVNDTADESNSLMKQRRSKSRLRSLLARDFKE